MAAVTMDLDQLNAERAVLKDGPVQLTIPRAMWDELGKPAELLVHLTTPGTEQLTLENVA